MAPPRRGELRVRARSFYDFIWAHNQPDPYRHKPPLCLRGRDVSRDDRNFISHMGYKTAGGLGRVDEILTTYGFTLNEFELWCEQRDIEPYL